LRIIRNGIIIFKTKMKSPNKQKTAKTRKKLKQRYYFLLNPFIDAAFTKCPKCETKTKIRKYWLLIHIEPYRLISLDKTCRFCPYCELIIVKKHELESLLHDICRENFPEIAGNEYFVYGTLDRKDCRKLQKEEWDFKTALEWAYAFKNEWKFKPAPMEWHPADKNLNKNLKK